MASGLPKFEDLVPEQLPDIAGLVPVDTINTITIQEDPTPRDELPTFDSLVPLDDTVPTPKQGELPNFKDLVAEDEADIPETSVSEAIRLGAIQGATWDFGDEISGAMDVVFDSFYGISEQNKVLKEKGLKGDIGPTNVFELYQEGRDEFRADEEKAKEEQAVAYYGSMIAGGIAVPGLGGVKVLKAVPGIKGAAAIGTAEGLVGGLGMSKGELLEGDVVTIAKDAAIGAGFGLALGGTIGTVAKYAPDIFKKTVRQKETPDYLLDHTIKTLSENESTIDLMGEIITKDLKAPDMTADRARSFTQYLERYRSADIDIDIIPEKFTQKAKAIEKMLEKESQETSDYLDWIELPSEKVSKSVSDVLVENDPLLEMARQAKMEGREDIVKEISGFTFLENESLKYAHWLTNHNVAQTFTPTSGTTKAGREIGEALFGEGVSGRGKIPFHEAVDKFVERKGRNVLSKLEVSRKNNQITPRMYKTFKAHEAMMERIAMDNGAEIVAKFGMGTPLDNVITKNVLDNRYAMASIDRKYDTNLEVLADKLNIGVEHHQKFFYDSMQGMKDLSKKASKAGLSQSQVHKILTDRDSYDGVIEKVTPEQKVIVEEWREVFEKLRQWGNSQGLDIDYRGNYAPQYAKQGIDFSHAIKTRTKSLNFPSFKDEDLDVIFNVPPSEWGKGFSKQEGIQELIELKKVLENTFDVNIADVNQLQKLSRQITDDMTMKHSMGFQANATFQREGEIPSFIQETDIEKLFMGYVNNLSKTVHTTAPLRDMEIYVPVLKELGANDAASYLRTYVSDISGIKRGSIGLSNNLHNRYKGLILDTFKSEFGKDNALAMGELVSAVTRSMYGNLLGMRVDKPLRNATQPFFLTATELSAGMSGKMKAMGYKAVGEAMAEAGVTQAKAGTKFFSTAKSALRDRGFPLPEFFQRNVHDFQESFKRGWVGKVVETLDTYNNISLKLYNYSDINNRYVTMLASDKYADNLISGFQAKLNDTPLSKIELNTKDWFQNILPPSYQKELIGHLQKGDYQKAKDSLALYHISKTQLIYNRTSMNQFGRTMGPLFSMLTKWPVSRFSDMYDITQRYGAGDAAKVLGEKYLFSLIGTGVAASLLDNTILPSDSPRSVALTGRKGVSAWSPGLSALGIFELGKSPALGPAEKALVIGADALTGNISNKKVQAMLREAQRLYMPGHSLMQFNKQFQGIVRNREVKNK